LKTEWNTAKINHNNNLSAFQKAFSNLINEKIYLNYLTNISLEKLLADSYTPINDVLDNTPNNSTFESSIDFQKFLTKEQLLNQQIQTTNPVPTNIGSSRIHWRQPIHAKYQSLFS
jgi:hypothetical protein